MRRAAVVLVALIAAGCGESKPPAATPAPTEATATATATAKAVATPAPKLSDKRPCADMPGATCYTLRVPLDRSGEVDGSLDLRVGIDGDAGKPVFVIVSGGPGEPGVPFMKRAREYLGPKLKDVRLVALDQRGTGKEALKCPELQATMGASDLIPPKADEVTKCAAEVGDQRRFFTTADTVEDYEALRQALGADELALDGISYGTYVAQRYALAHPDRVSGLVLDSVVPSGGASLLSEVSIKATRRVLGEDTARDLAKVIREQHNGPQMLDMLTSLSVGAPRGNGAAAAIHAAAEGNPKPLEGLQHGVQQVVTGWKAEMLSQGLHASTLCADTPAPWGSAAAPTKGRQQALDAAAAKLSDADLFPYDRATATGNGIALQCLYWPPVRVPDPPAAGELPDVPTILLAGDHDLSTPMEWAQDAAKHAPNGRLIIVKDNGHGVQGQDDPKALGAVRELAANL